MAKKDRKIMEMKRAKKREQKEKERKIKRKEKEGAERQPTLAIPSELSGQEGNMTQERLMELAGKTGSLVEVPQLQDIKFNSALAMTYTQQASYKYKDEMDMAEPSDEMVIIYYSEILENLLTREIKKELKKGLQAYAQYQAKRGNEEKAMIAIVAEGMMLDRTIPLGAQPLLINLYKQSIGLEFEDYQWQDIKESLPLEKAAQQPPVETKKEKPSLFKRIINAVKKARAGE